MSNPAPDDRRTHRIRTATFEFLSLRNGGHTVSVEVFCDQNLDLMPEIEQSLRRGLQHLQQTVDAERVEDGMKTLPSSANVASNQFPRIRGYQVQSEVSGGGQGTVYRAIQESTGRTVALKVVPHTTRSSVARFEREVQSLASVDDPGIVGVIDRGRTADNAYYLAMAYVEGRQLDEWVAGLDRRPETQRLIVQVFCFIAQAMAAAHLRGIVHRDLKPANVRVTTLGKPCIVDFGLAYLVQQSGRQAKELTVTGNIVGSIPWSSPEQAAGNREVTPATDVYALGVMLYELLIGRFPYQIDGPLHQTTRHICETPPTPPQKVRQPRFGEIDDALSAILLKCLSKQPERRYASGSALAADLHRYLDGEKVIAASPRRRRWRPLAYLGISISAVVTSAMLFGTTRPVHSGEALQLPTVTNSLGMHFITLPSGTFSMGSSDAEVGRDAEEQRHLVHVDQHFAIGETEVTRGQYRRVMGNLPPGSGDGAAELPVDHISFEEAQLFCLKLSALEGKQYRLPSESEWEYACRAGTESKFSNTDDLKAIAWFDGNSSGRLHPVALLQPNRWGIYDMEGNVSEWVADGFIPFLGTADRSAVAVGSTSGRVLRGGTAFDAADHCRSASRFAISPTQVQAGFGFRVVQEIP